MTQTASDTLIGTKMPDVAVQATDGRQVNLSRLSGLCVVYAYPRTSPPNAAPIEGWDLIPGARGCTPQSCGFRDHHAELRKVGVDHVFGLSTQDTAYQQEAVERLHLPFAVLSDSDLHLATALGLETFEAGGMTLLKRVTIIVRDGVLIHHMPDITEPDQNAADVIAWLRRTTTEAAQEKAS